MPNEISLPFALAADGSVQVESDPDRQINNHVRGLVATQPGERAMMFNYGVDTLNLLFEPNSVFIQQQLGTSVQQALTQWEPGVIVKSVTPIANEQGDGLVSVEVDYTRSDSALTPSVLARHVNTATIRVGGTVEEQVIG